MAEININLWLQDEIERHGAQMAEEQMRLQGFHPIGATLIDTTNGFLSYRVRLPASSSKLGDVASVDVHLLVADVLRDYMRVGTD